MPSAEHAVSQHARRGSACVRANKGKKQPSSLTDPRGLRWARGPTRRAPLRAASTQAPIARVSARHTVPPQRTTVVVRVSAPRSRRPDTRPTSCPHSDLRFDAGAWVTVYQGSAAVCETDTEARELVPFSGSLPISAPKQVTHNRYPSTSTTTTTNPNYHDDHKPTSQPTLPSDRVRSVTSNE